MGGVLISLALFNIYTMMTIYNQHTCSKEGEKTGELLQHFHILSQQNFTQKTVSVHFLPNVIFIICYSVINIISPYYKYYEKHCT